jgi:hypothetical protein
MNLESLSSEVDVICEHGWALDAAYAIGPTWHCRALYDKPQGVKGGHLKFARAGVEVVDFTPPVFDGPTGQFVEVELPGAVDTLAHIRHALVQPQVTGLLEFTIRHLNGGLHLASVDKDKDSADFVGYFRFAEPHTHGDCRMAMNRDGVDCMLEMAYQLVRLGELSPRATLRVGFGMPTMVASEAMCTANTLSVVCEGVTKCVFVDTHDAPILPNRQRKCL